MTNINDLPIEAFIEILSRTDGITLGKCRRVCKKWMEILNDFDQLWHKVCKTDFKYSSKIAKRKSGENCNWYHIYKNLQIWSNITNYDRTLKEFYKFAVHDKCHALHIDYSILPLRDTRGIVLYDTTTLKYIPVVVPTRDCLKISNNEHSTVILLKSGLFLQRTVENESHMSEAFYKADNFVLQPDALYFYNNRDVYKCDLVTENLTSKLLLNSLYDIKEVQYNDGQLHLFTDCGKIVTIHNNIVKEKSINCPPEWVRQIKHISAIDDKNFICYSRNLFKIETDRYQHTYLSTTLDFPPITALFFYGEVVLIGTKLGEILLYRLSSQKHATKPIFEMLAVLPDGKFAVYLDVCERNSGPVIIVATFFEIMLMEITFFPHEQTGKANKSFSNNKLILYKRLSRLKDRLQY